MNVPTSTAFLFADNITRTDSTVFKIRVPSIKLLGMNVSSDIHAFHTHIQINGYHRLLAKRFPYAIYYKYSNTSIKIYAVLDCRSNPKKIEKKLT